MRGIFTVKNKKIRRRLYLVFSYSGHLLPKLPAFASHIPGVFLKKSEIFRNSCIMATHRLNSAN